MYLCADLLGFQFHQVLFNKLYLLLRIVFDGHIKETAITQTLKQDLYKKIK